MLTADQAKTDRYRLQTNPGLSELVKQRSPGRLRKFAQGMGHFASLGSVMGQLQQSFIQYGDL